MDNGVDIIRRIYDGFDLGDLAPLLDSLDPDVEWNEAEYVTFWPGAAFRGPAAIVEGPFSRIPHTVIMQGRYSGTARSTGRQLSPQVAHIWDFVDTA